jgi:hypothetical protein
MYVFSEKESTRDYPVEPNQATHYLDRNSIYQGCSTERSKALDGEIARLVNNRVRPSKLYSSRNLFCLEPQACLLGLLDEGIAGSFLTDITPVHFIPWIINVYSPPNESRGAHYSLQPRGSRGLRHRPIHDHTSHPRCCHEYEPTQTYSNTPKL